MGVLKTAPGCLENRPSAFTVEGWFNITTADWIVAKWGGTFSDQPFALTFEAGSGYRLYVFLNGAARAYTYDNAFVPGGTQWLHVAVVYNGAGATDAQKLQIYVNGVNQVWGYLNTPLPASLQSGGASVFQFGCVSNHGSWGSSTQDEVRVYALAKTAAQIATDYNSGLGSCGAGAEAGLRRGFERGFETPMSYADAMTPHTQASRCSPAP